MVIVIVTQAGSCGRWISGNEISSKLPIEIKPSAKYEASSSVVELDLFILNCLFDGLAARRRGKRK